MGDSTVSVVEHTCELQCLGGLQVQDQHGLHSKACLKKPNQTNKIRKESIVLKKLCHKTHIYC